MLTVRVTEDLEECERIWRQVWPRRCIFDIWEVRTCFSACFDTTPYFIVAEEHGTISGLLALSWIAESNGYGQFPGETWRAKTWLEQNKIPAYSQQAFQALLESVPGDLHLRYLDPDFLPSEYCPCAVDEIGFLFFPDRYNCSMNIYMLEFSRKSRKQLAREIELLQSSGVAFRYGRRADIDWMFRKNLESFGEHSYFNDRRFQASYEKLVGYLSDNGLLRVTTVLLGGTVAAVDIGALWNNDYTVLAGATSPDFCGVAKIINLHHLEWACSRRIRVIDFLCGDFGWKNRFHLTPRPLFEIRHQSAADRRIGMHAVAAG